MVKSLQMSNRFCLYLSVYLNSSMYIKAFITAKKQPSCKASYNYGSEDTKHTALFTPLYFGLFLQDFFFKAVVCVYFSLF